MEIVCRVYSLKYINIAVLFILEVNYSIRSICRVVCEFVLRIWNGTVCSERISYAIPCLDLGLECELFTDSLDYGTAESDK